MINQLRYLAQNTLDFAGTAVDQKLPGATDQVVNNPSSGFSDLLSRVLNIALTVATIAVLLYLIWGAIDWITAGGDKGKTEKARDKITQGIIGLVLLIASMAILMFVQQLFGYCMISIGGACNLNTTSSSACNQGESVCNAGTRYVCNGGMYTPMGPCP